MDVVFPGGERPASSRLNRALLVSSLIVLAACAGPARQQPIGAELHNQCPQQRPEVCTMEYAPVCAVLDKGERKQYASFCNACADPLVQGYISGPCP